jgi:hypothetical protein
MVPECTKFDSRVRRLHDLAEQIRGVAEAMHDLECRRTMLLTAASYKRMANQLEPLTRHLSLPEEFSPQLSPELEISTIAEPK